MVRNRAGRLLAAAAVLTALGTSVASGQHASGLRILELSSSRPPCSGSAGLPIVPNDPGAVTDASGQRRCYGTRPPVLVLQMPEERWLWLKNADTSPAAWIAVGPVLVDPDELETPALGLRLTDGGDGPVLESRYADRGTIAPLRTGEWQAVRLADGRRVWVRLGDRAR